MAARRTPDLRSLERLEVFHNHERVGALTRTTRGARFEYEQAFFEAHRTREGGLVSSLPFRNRVVEVSGVNLPTYFAGLLPEGLRLRSLVQRLKTSEDDLFSLLAATGSDAVGDVFAVVPGERPTLDLEPEAQLALDQVSFDDLFRRSLDVGAEPTVPGVQEKLSPSVISFPFATRGRRFLLKLDPPDKPGMVRNEHFFMSMAQACGLRVARTSLVTDATGAPGLLVERFDRRRVGRRCASTGQPAWSVFLALDEVVAEVAKEADTRLAWQGQFSVERRPTAAEPTLSASRFCGSPTLSRCKRGDCDSEDARPGRECEHCRLQVETHEAVSDGHQRKGCGSEEKQLTWESATWRQPHQRHRHRAEARDQIQLRWMEGHLMQ